MTFVSANSGTTITLSSGGELHKTKKA